MGILVQIAELVDNSIDAKASEFSIDVEGVTDIKSENYFKDPLRLIFQDDGDGMSPDELHRMLSFGHCDKDLREMEEGRSYIGHYGNGFKSGSMRIGKDVLVFTKNGETESIGFLSQSYLGAINAREILVPIISFNSKTKNPIANFQTLEECQLSDMDENNPYKLNIAAITTHSIFKTIEMLKSQLDFIEEKGTRVVVWGLKEVADDDGNITSEIDFSSDSTDIILPIELKNCLSNPKEHPPENYSLKAYLAVLYLNPTLIIWLRGHRVFSRAVLSSLYRGKIYPYHPRGEPQSIDVVLGFNRLNREHFGMMIYHKNRLVKMYMRIGFQFDPSSRGKGVLGIINTEHLKPTHNKQDFLNDDNYRLLMSKLKDLLTTYWREDTGIVTGGLTRFNKELDQLKDQGPWWIQCYKVGCMKWRKIQKHPNELNEEEWECSMNEDNDYNDCSIPQEPFDLFTHQRRRGKKRANVEEDEENLTNNNNQEVAVDENSDEDSGFFVQRPKRFSKAPERFTLSDDDDEDFRSTPKSKSKKKLKKKTSDVGPTDEGCDSCERWQKKIERIYTSLTGKSKNFPTPKSFKKSYFKELKEIVNQSNSNVNNNNNNNEEYIHTLEEKVSRLEKEMGLLSADLVNSEAILKRTIESRKKLLDRITEFEKFKAYENFMRLNEKKLKIPKTEAGTVSLSGNSNSAHEVIDLNSDDGEDEVSSISFTSQQIKPEMSVENYQNGEEESEDEEETVMVSFL